MTGFYSKEILLETTYGTYNLFSILTFIYGNLIAVLTSLYATRIFFLTFLMSSNSFRYISENIHEPTYMLILSMIPLMIGAIFFGYLYNDLFIGFGSMFWINNFQVNYNDYWLLHVEYLSIFIKLLPIIAIIIGILFIIYIYVIRIICIYNKIYNLYFYKIYNCLAQVIFFDRLLKHYLIMNFFKLCYIYIFKHVDRGLFKQIGPIGLQNLILYVAINLKYVHYGFLLRYINFIFFVIVVLQLFLII